MIYNVTINKINNPIKRFISLRFISFRIFNCNLLALTNKNGFECWYHEGWHHEEYHYVAHQKVELKNIEDCFIGQPVEYKGGFSFGELVAKEVHWSQNHQSDAK